MASVAVVWSVPVLVQLPLFFNLYVLWAVHKLLTFDLNCPCPQHRPHSSPPVSFWQLLSCFPCCYLCFSLPCLSFVYRFNRPWIITRWLPWPQQVPFSFAHSNPPCPSSCVLALLWLLVFIIVNFLDETLICCPSTQRQNGTAKTLPNSCSPSLSSPPLPPFSALVNSRPSRKSVRVSYVGFIKIFSFILFASDANSAAFSTGT